LVDLLEPYFKLEETFKTKNKTMKVVLDLKMEYTKLQIVKVVVVVGAKINETTGATYSILT